MRSIQLIVLFGLLSTTSFSQAYHCGMFGMIEDDYGRMYIGNFNTTLDSIKATNVVTCDVTTVPIEIISVTHRRRYTYIHLYIKGKEFDDLPYRIKYPTGAWGIISNEPGHW